MTAAAEHAPAEVEPSLDEVRELAREHNLIPLRHTFIDDCETPVTAFLKLRGRTPEFPAFLLESAEQGQRVGRYSFIGVRPRKVLRWSLGDAGDPYALAAEAVGRHRQAPLPDLPPFAGGAVGFFGYDLVRTVEPLGEPNPDPVGLPDMALMLSDVLVVFDHLKHTVTILVNVYADDDGELDAAYADALATIDKARDAARRAGAAARRPGPRARRSRRSRRTCRASTSRRWSRGSSSTSTPATPSRSCRRSAGRPTSRSTRSRSTAACASSTRARTCTSWTSSTSRSPAPRPSRCSPSPAATPRRGRSPARGRAAPTPPRTSAIAEGLLADEKERAEHVMLVDLGRNDLGRVCEYGTVNVDTFMAVETYSHVMHIVSSVSGELRADDRRDGRAALDPAGRHAHRRAEGPRDADHRRARARQARRLRRRDRLPELHRRPRHLHPHPHGRRQGRHRARPGRRRHGRRRQARLRVRGVRGQGQGRQGRIELAARAAGVA